MSFLSWLRGTLSPSPPPAKKKLEEKPRARRTLNFGAELIPPDYSKQFNENTTPDDIFNAIYAIHQHEGLTEKPKHYEALFRAVITSRSFYLLALLYHTEKNQSDSQRVVHQVVHNDELLPLWRKALQADELKIFHRAVLLHEIEGQHPFDTLAADYFAKQGEWYFAAMPTIRDALGLAYQDKDKITIVERLQQGLDIYRQERLSTEKLEKAIADINKPNSDIKKILWDLYRHHAKIACEWLKKGEQLGSFYAQYYLYMISRFLLDDMRILAISDVPEPLEILKILAPLDHTLPSDFEATMSNFRIQLTKLMVERSKYAAETHGAIGCLMAANTYVHLSEYYEALQRQRDGELATTNTTRMLYYPDAVKFMWIAILLWEKQQKQINNGLQRTPLSRSIFLNYTDRPTTKEFLRKCKQNLDPTSAQQIEAEARELVLTMRS